MAEAVAGRGTILRAELDRYLREKQTNSDTSVSKKTPPPSSSNQRTISKAVASSTREEICAENKIEFDKYKNQLVLKGYSKSTMRTYCGEFSVFLKVLSKTLAKDLTPDHLQRYIFYIVLTRLNLVRIQYIAG